MSINLFEIVHVLLICAGMILLIYLGSTVLYLLVFAVAGQFKGRCKSVSSTGEKRRVAVLIPCYKEDEVILEVADEALNQNYPRNRYDVVVIADSFNSDTIVKLRTKPVKLIQVAFQISSKSRALNAALTQLSEPYDIAVVLDGDNIMDRNFLSKINDSFNSGCTIVQGHRVAKNLNTSFAILDAISEEINNHIFRKGHSALGLSSALIGSAMAFEYHFFKEIMPTVEVVGGFDKEIELKLASAGKKICYRPDAYVYDEKVQSAESFSRQRRRWLSAQLHYFGKSFFPALRQLVLHGNFEYFNKAFQYVQPPRVLLLGFLLIATIVSVLLSDKVLIAISVGMFSAGALALLLSTPARYYSPKTLFALLTLPYGFILMLGSLFKVRGANKQFIHTKHTYNAFQSHKRRKEWQKLKNNTAPANEKNDYLTGQGL